VDEENWGMWTAGRTVFAIGNCTVVGGSESFGFCGHFGEGVKGNNYDSTSMKNIEIEETFF
jgi:hypothetical protein